MGNVLNLLLMLATAQSTVWKLDFEIEFNVECEAMAPGARWTQTLRREIGNGSWRDERYTEHYRRSVGIDEERTIVARCERGEFFVTMQLNARKLDFGATSEWKYVNAVKDMKNFRWTVGHRLKLVKDAPVERKEIAGIRCIKEQRETEGYRIVLWLPENADDFEKFGYLEGTRLAHGADKVWTVFEHIAAKRIKRG